jgi:hypothetical protein
MKCLLNSFVCILIVCSAGCATSKQVAQMEGRGKQQVFPASYDQVWRAAVDAAQISDLQVRSADKENGYISAGRGMRVHTHGENVGIWVKQVSPVETSVEVLSRQAGPPKFWFKNWEDEILSALNANLTKETVTLPVLTEPAGVEYHRDYKTRETIIQPERQY